jgi:phosphatidyl-myo-inositol alpha-mannosyltransferase
MKVAIFSPYNFQRHGGVQDIVDYQVKELRKRGHDVIIITPRPREYTAEPPEGIVFMGISAKVKAQSSTPDVSAVIDQDEVERFFSENVFDVVHFHEPVVPFVGRQLISQCPYPVVATLHAALPETGIGRTLGSIKPYFRSVLQYVDVFTRVSPAAGEYLDGLLDTQAVIDVPNGVSVSDFTPSNKRDPNMILYVGRLEKRKGPKYLIEAFAEVSNMHPDARLVIVGDGHDREKLHELANEMGVSEKIEFKGFVSQEEKIGLLRKAALACYPAIYGESFGIVLLEAMATGTPIIAGDNPGYSSVLNEKGLLCLVDPTNTSDFARRIQLYLENKDIRDMLSTWGLEYVKQFDYPKIVDAYLDVYAQAIAMKKKK